jgi:hypothetical protein
MVSYASKTVSSPQYEVHLKNISNLSPGPLLSRRLFILVGFRVISIFTLLVLANISIARSQSRPLTELRNPTWRVRTSCVTEIRGGKKSCRGIVIEFDDAQFKAKVSPQQLKIYEAKHGSSLLKVMTWRVSPDRKRLTIRFKAGTGDFGSGNRAEVTMYKEAFIVPPKNFPEYVIFVQETDLRRISKSERNRALRDDSPVSSEFE